MLAEVMEDRLTRSLLFHAGQRCRPAGSPDVVDFSALEIILPPT